MKNKLHSLEIPTSSYRVSTLEIRLQKIAFFVLIILIALAIFGFFGGGSILHSQQVTSSNKQLTVNYDYAMRAGTTDMLTLHVFAHDNSVKNGELVVRSQNFSKFPIKEVTPTPRKVELSAEGDLYYFNIDRNLKEAVIYFILEPTKHGLLSTTFSLQNKESVTIKQTILP